MAIKIKPGFLFLVILVPALLFRFSGLAIRPMHTDEAVHAVKFGELLDNGVYLFDKNEYHGPTLNYLTLIAARLGSFDSFVSLNESILRSVPAFFGVLIVMLMALLARYTGWRIVIMAAFMLAISPAMVYYSRYYIHEMLLIFFNLAFIVFLYRYIRSRKPAWIMLSGIFAGLMFSTKSTWIIIFAGQVIAFLITARIYYGNLKPARYMSANCFLSHILIFIFSAAIPSLLLYSSFFANPAGIADSIITYKDYFSRAGAEGLHIHPWHYYISLISVDSCSPFPFRADLWILLSGFAGMIMAFTGKFPKSGINKDSMKSGNHPIILFAAISALFSGIVFSALPYKTPWNILYFYSTMIILSAFFFVHIIKKTGNIRLKAGYLAILTIIFVHLGWQSYSDNFITYASPCNPYAYAHPGNDVLTIANEAEKVASVSPEGKNMYIEIIVSDNGYWPLPWYLREFPNTGWWDEIDMEMPAAPFIICSPASLPLLTRKLYEIPPPGQRRLYIPLLEHDPELRPGTEVSLYLRKDYYDRYTGI